MGGVKLLSGIKSMYFDSSVCARVKGSESEQFRVDSGVRHGCIMSPRLFNVYIYGWSDEGGEDGDGMEGSELHGGWERVEISLLLVCR